MFFKVAVYRTLVSIGERELGGRKKDREQHSWLVDLTLQLGHHPFPTQPAAGGKMRRMSSWLGLGFRTAQLWGKRTNQFLLSHRAISLQTVENLLIRSLCVPLSLRDKNSYSPTIPWNQSLDTSEFAKGTNTMQIDQKQKPGLLQPWSSTLSYKINGPSNHPFELIN